MFDGLFNGLFRSNRNSGYNKIVEQIKSEQAEVQKQFYSTDLNMLTAAQAQILNQQKAMMNQLGSHWAQAYQVNGEMVAIRRSEYIELRHLHYWCKNTHPEIYEEWCAMRDLERVSKDESL